MGNLTAIKETFELLKPIVDSIDKVFIMDSIVDNLDGTYTINTCNTLWATYSRTVTINAIDYVIVELVVNQSIKVKGASIPTGTQFDLYEPYFFHGTVIAQQEEMNNIENSWDKLPMIYLNEITRERFDLEVDSSIERESECNIFVMVDVNMGDWKTTTHYEQAVRPMRNLAFRLIEAIKNANNVGVLTSFDLLDHARWGVYLSASGHPKKIFADDLSGTQLRINIPFLNSNNCNC